MSGSNIRIASVIAARNEEELIEKTIVSLKAQTFPIGIIIVVDDGSTDRTAEIALSMGCIVIRLPYHEESYVGRPELAKVFNAGLKLIPSDYNYVLILGADHPLPKEYVENLLNAMIKENVFIASGWIKDEPFHPDIPRGSGRIYAFKLLREIGFFPENWGWEAYVVFKAMKMGYKTKCFKHIVSKKLRPVSRSPEKMLYLGKAMKALGYDFKYAIARAIVNGSWSMLKGYLSKDVKPYEDVRDFVKEWQKHMFWFRVKEAILKRG